MFKLKTDDLAFLSSSNNLQRPCAILDQDGDISGKLFHLARNLKNWIKFFCNMVLVNKYIALHYLRPSFLCDFFHSWKVILFDTYAIVFIAFHFRVLSSISCSILKLFLLFLYSRTVDAFCVSSFTKWASLQFLLFECPDWLIERFVFSHLFLTRRSFHWSKS